MTPLEQQTSHALDALTAAILQLVHDSGTDPAVVPFAALLAAARVGMDAASADEHTRLRFAAALVVVLREVAPEWVVDVPASHTAH